MKNMLAFLFAASLALVFCSCGREPDTLVKDGYDEKEMDAAIARARNEVDAFIVILKKGDGVNFAVKVPINDKGQVEHFWLSDIAYSDGAFKGKIGNEPGMVTNVKFGQEWTVKKQDVSDWMYMKNNKIYGNYTLRPLLKTMKKEEADKWRAMLANP